MVRFPFSVTLVFVMPDAAIVVKVGAAGELLSQPDPVTVIFIVPGGVPVVVRVVDPAGNAFGDPVTNTPPLVAVPFKPDDPISTVNEPVAVTVGVFGLPSNRLTGDPVIVPELLVIVPSRIVEFGPA